MARNKPSRRQRRKREDDHNQAHEVSPMSALEEQFLKRIQGMSSSQRTTYTIVGALAGVALLVFASLPFFTLPQWAQTVIAFPAAIIFFLIISGFIHLREERKEVKFKEKHSFRARRSFGLYAGVGLIVIILVVGTKIPYAVAGSLLVVGALLILNMLRRTPEELAIAEAGLTDVRDLTPEELAYLQELEEQEHAEGFTDDTDDRFYDASS